MKYDRRSSARTISGIKMEDDAQALADTLSGRDTVILHSDMSSPSAPLSALSVPNASGLGIYTPGDQIVEDIDEEEVPAAIPSGESDRTAKKPSKSPQKFTGAPEGKGKLT